MNEILDYSSLREFVRLLERKLGILQKSEVSCCGVTFSQCHAIVEIGRAGSISLNDLSELLNLDNSTMSRTVNNLVTGGFAQREINSADRRYVSIGLTENGKMIFTDIESSMSDYYKKVYDCIPEDKRRQVIESLDILLRAINDSEGK